MAPPLLELRCYLPSSLPVGVIVAYRDKREQALMLKVNRIFVVSVLSVSPRPVNPMPAPDGMESAAGKIEEKIKGEGESADSDKSLCGSVMPAETLAEDVLLPRSSSFAKDASEAGKDAGMLHDSAEETKAGAISPPAVALQGHSPNSGGDGDGLRGGDGPPPTNPAGSEVYEPTTLWARLPQDVTGDVLRAVKVPELKVGLRRASSVLRFRGVIESAHGCCGRFGITLRRC